MNTLVDQINAQMVATFLYYLRSYSATKIWMLIHLYRKQQLRGLDQMSYSSIMIHMWDTLVAGSVKLVWMSRRLILTRGRFSIMAK
jgi:hypothetical protein